MKNESLHIKNILIILSGILFGIFINFVHLSTKLHFFNYLPIVIFLFYLNISFSKYINVELGLIIGLILDVIYNTYIGKHSIVLVLSLFFLTKINTKLISLCYFRKLFIVFCFIFTYQIIILLFYLFINYLVIYYIFYNSLISIIIWILLEFLFSKLLYYRE